jgi:hypothetical protein
MKITSDWDKLAFALTVKGKPRSGKFVSRQTGRTANGDILKKVKKSKRKGLAERATFEFIPSPEVKKDKEGKITFQSRKGGKFGKKLEISQSLAEKLGIEIK